MSSFTSEPLLEKLPRSKFWVVKRPFTYHVGSRYSNFKIKIPYGFVTDLASIPRPFWAIFPPFAFGYFKPAILHDFCYQSKIVSRAQADAIFLEAMTVLKVNPIVRGIIHSSVRLFGWLGYKENNLSTNMCKS